MTLEIVISLIGILLAWIAFIEKRLRDMMRDVEEKIVERNKINLVIQENLKDKLDRVEEKLDFVIQELLKSK
jgi:hypothetical protein